MEKYYDAKSGICNKSKRNFKGKEDYAIQNLPKHRPVSKHGQLHFPRKNESFQL